MKAATFVLKGDNKEIIRRNMNAEDMMKKYDKLYDKMATSGKIDNMRLFGKVGREAMLLVVKNMPERATELIEKLESINWNNYLTEKESEAVTTKMDPQRPWSKDQWLMAMEKHGLPLEEEPYYNRCALFTTMCMIYSDDGDTLKRYANEGNMFELVHALAVNKLKDKDRVFSVRKYFEV